MKKAGVLLVVAIGLLSSGFSDKGRWVIGDESRLSIHGSTNINNFTCEMNCYTGSDTLLYEKNYSACEIRFHRNRMTIPVRSFDCGARQISKDFWKTLKSETYPQLDIRFRSLQNISVKDNTFIKGVIDITLAGVTARYTVRYHVNVTANNTILLKGMHPVNFSDFKLEAPEKMQGLIRVKEVLNVEFNLVLKTV